MSLRSIPILLALATASPAFAAPSVPLQPPPGFPFAPEGPRAVGPGHPLFHALALEPVADMPPKVGKFLIRITSAEEFNTALRQTLEQANMLAPAGTSPKARLEARWISLDAPARISVSSEATATLRYTLFRAGSGEPIFQREIRTFSKSSGGEASERLKGNARLALMTNLASAVLCLDKGAEQQAPADCALVPNATYRAPRPATVVFVPR